jgi:hypothetical protein
MALIPSEPTPQIFLQNFTTVITVVSATNIISVVADVVDTGVVVSYGTDTVTLSGKYQSVLPITWQWKDLADQLQSGTSAPAVGTYQKMIKLDSPPVRTQDCNYTITSDVGEDIFLHVVTVDYDELARELTTLLDGQPGP